MTDRAAAMRSFERRMRRERAVAADVVACASVTDTVERAAARMSRVIARMVLREWSISARSTMRRLGVELRLVRSKRIVSVVDRCVIDPAGWSMRKLRAVAQTLVVTMMTSARTAGALDVADALSHVELARVKRKRRPRLTKEWVSLGDAKTCEECDEMDGDVVNAYSMFRLSADRTPKAYDYHGEKIEGPELHPNCRCDLLVSYA